MRNGLLSGLVNSAPGRHVTKLCFVRLISQRFATEFECQGCQRNLGRISLVIMRALMKLKKPSIL